MTQYNTLNVKLLNSQLNKLKSGINNGTKITFNITNGTKILSNIFGGSNNENNSLHKSTLTNTQVSRLSKPFANIFSANIKLSKTQFHKIRQVGEFLGKLLGPLLKTGLSLTGNFNH